MTMYTHPETYTHTTASMDHIEVSQYSPTPRKYTTLLSEFVYTTYLFIRSDIRTTLAPITVFGLVNAPKPTLSRAFPVMFWVFLHLLQFVISNQYLPSSIIEDTTNKPYRPIPSGHITVKRATQLRWALVPLCLALSGLYGTQVLYLSVICLCVTAAYNDLGGSAYWLTRDTLNGTSFAGLMAAAILIVNPDHKLTNSNITTVLIGAATFATTTFAQDFKDVIGDKLVNRTTIPTVFPQGITRVILAVLVLGWSTIFLTLWTLPMVAKVIYFSLAIALGFRFIFYRSPEEDKTSYYYFYNLWIASSFAVPGYNALVANRLL